MVGVDGAGSLAPRLVPTPDGRDLAVCEWGDPDGRPLCFLHGIPGSRLLRHLTDDGADVYAELGLRIVTYDRPGYGGSTRRPGRRVVDVAEDVLVIADALGIGRFAVMGVSGGAAHALAVAARHPDRVTRCALELAPAPFSAPDLDYFAGMGEVHRREWDFATLNGDELERWLKRDAEETTEMLRTGLGDPGMPPAIVEFFRAALEGLRPGPGGMWDDLLALVGDWGFDVRDVRVPVRLLQGEEDESVPPAHTEWWLTHLRDVHVEWSPGGHIAPRLQQELQLLAWAAGVPSI